MILTGWLAGTNRRYEKKGNSHKILNLIIYTVWPLMSGHLFSGPLLSGHPPISDHFQFESPDLSVNCSIQRPPLLGGRGHPFCCRKCITLLIWFSTSIKRPADYPSKHWRTVLNQILSADAKRPKKLVNDVLHFLYIINQKKYCTFQLCALCVRARTIHGLEMHWMFCCNEFWSYLHICSLFKSILLYRGNKIRLFAFPIQFILYLAPCIRRLSPQYDRQSKFWCPNETMR